MGLEDPKDQCPDQADSQGRDAGRDFTLVKGLIIAVQPYPILPSSQSHICCLSLHTPYKQQFKHKWIQKLNPKHQNQSGLQSPT